MMSGRIHPTMQPAEIRSNGSYSSDKKENYFWSFVVDEVEQGNRVPGRFDRIGEIFSMNNQEEDLARERFKEFVISSLSLALEKDSSGNVGHRSSLLPVSNGIYRYEFCRTKLFEMFETIESDLKRGRDFLFGSEGANRADLLTNEQQEHVKIIKSLDDEFKNLNRRLQIGAILAQRSNRFADLNNYDRSVISFLTLQRDAQNQTDPTDHDFAWPLVVDPATYRSVGTSPMPDSLNSSASESSLQDSCVTLPHCGNDWSSNNSSMVYQIPLPENYAPKKDLYVEDWHTFNARLPQALKNWQYQQK